MDSEEPGVGNFFMALLLIVTVVIVAGIIIYVRHVPAF